MGSLAAHDRSMTCNPVIANCVHSQHGKTCPEQTAATHGQPIRDQPPARGVARGGGGGLTTSRPKGVM